MSQIYFTEDHEWVRVEDDGTATIGITTFATNQLGDIVFVELPEVGKTVGQGEQAAVVESVKAASEVYSAVSGEVLETNQAIADDPGSVNEDPMGAAWFFKLKLSAPEELEKLMDQAAYDDFTAKQG